MNTNSKSISKKKAVLPYSGYPNAAMKAYWNDDKMHVIVLIRLHN